MVSTPSPLGPHPESGNSVPPQIFPWGPTGSSAPSCPNLPDPAAWASLPLGPHREERPRNPPGLGPMG